MALEPVAPRPRAYDLLLQVGTARGVVEYGPFLPARMHALGLSEIDAEGRVFRWTGGSRGPG